VALARAIVPRPGVLLMDEPFSGLDSRLRDSVRADTLSILREAGATAIIVTHDPEEAMRMADRIVLMRGGRIVQEGGAEDLYDRPQSLFAARFFSALNELPGTVGAGRAATPIADFACRGHAEGASVVVAIRPRGVVLAAAGAGVEGRPGRIRARYFLGEVELFDVAVEGSPTYLLAKARAGDGLGPGSDVMVSFDERDVLVFPEGG
jgi:iron(III) transport system ATP-binding protein